MKRYKITYEQEFMGKILEYSYIRSINNEDEIHNVIEALYEDPHVFSVDYEELKE